MKTHTEEQLLQPSSAGTYRYLLSRDGPLLTLKHLAEVLHSIPNGVRMTLPRHRQSLSMALARLRRRLGRRVYFDVLGVAQAIDAKASRVEKNGCPLSPATEVMNEAIVGTWVGSPR